MQELGTIEPVHPRDVWQDEAEHFTPWLASPQGLSLLSETLGLDLELVSVERRVGSFKADIVARMVGEEDDEVYVVVENQLERTNHDHLGKLITYSAGLNATTIVWVADGFTEEHRQALDWLNENTPGLNFFGLQVEVIRIGNSPPAPQLRIVSSPNEWAKAIKAEKVREVSATKLEQLGFWEELREYSRGLEHAPLHLSRTPRPQHWYEIAIGRSGFKISLTVNSRENLVGCEVYISMDDATKTAFDLLYEQREAVEAELGSQLEWQRLDEKIASRIVLYRSGDFLHPEQRGELLAWLYDQAVAFEQVFGPRIRDLAI